MKKERLKNSSKTFLNQWNQWVFVNCKQKSEEISTTRLRHVNYYIHSSSIYAQESENKIQKGRKSKVRIIAAIAR